MLQGARNNVLPIDYIRLEFLESTGTQYIRARELVVDNTDVIKSTFSLTGYKEGSANGIFSIFGYDKGEKLRVYTTNNVSENKRYLLCQWATASYRGGLAAVNEKINCELAANGCLVNGTPSDVPDATVFSWADVLIFNQFVLNQYWPSLVRLYSFSVSKKCSLLPAIDSAGKPCMYDAVTGKTFYNEGTGTFVAGFTLAQARKLGKLPVGTKLTISLPVGWQEDEGVAAAKAQAEANGCVLPVQEYTEGASAAATYALRRVWVRRTQDDNGSYVDAENTRWQIDWCVDVIGADPESLGYERFRSVEVAAEYWGLTEYVDPETETIES